MNAFLTEDFYPDWQAMSADKIVPAVEASLTSAKAAVAEICSQSEADCNFRDTVVAFAESTRGLERVWSRVRHLEGVENSPALREAYEKVLPSVTDFFCGLTLNADLWRVIKTAARKTVPADLTPAERRLLEETLEDFRENGADLPDDKKKRLAEINAALAKKTSQFTNNVLDATNAWEKIIDDGSLLKGVPATTLEAAALSAKSKGFPEGTWRFTLQAPILSPVMRYAENDALRKEFWEASNAVARGGKFDNTELIREILALRHEMAILLGFKNFADYTTCRRMAKNGGNALRFVEDLRSRIEPFLQKENEELIAFAKNSGDKTALASGKIAPWAIEYWSEKLRREKYDFDEELLRPYFPIDSVIAGAFEVVNRLYGIEVRENTAVKAWNDAVKTYEIFDGEKMLGAFYTDWFPRESKRSGAWMDALETAEYENTPHSKFGVPAGTAKPHLGLIVGNFTCPTPDKPALLNFLEVTTLFHEFGHLLHHVLSEVEIPDLAGTAVAWDFVELPSQIMENWCKHAESLKIFAKHYVTGEVLPEALLDKLLKAKNFRAAAGTLRQLSFGKMDLDFHCFPEIYGNVDFEDYWNKTIGDYLIPTSEPQICMVYKFLHLFSEPVGYAAGYYSYKWAEMLDADCFTRFLKEGIFNRATGTDFRQKILARGNLVPADCLFRDFMGREPSPEALLEREDLA
ncbi:MAG: M3 family metallopeptidase [Opitutales bacterium]|nr:M3 family metallopeptidase [Opitutales bacterium]